jgi:CHAT domain-containing protein
MQSPVRLDLSPLPGVKQELDDLQARFGDKLTCLDNERATVAEVLHSVHEHSWIHLACHGVQDREIPTNSGFLLHDGLLTLSELIPESSKGAELAFLSACETAMGDMKVPDEAVHLAAGMLAVGYRHVVGSMWAINDEDAPFVADAFYKVLLDDRLREGRKEGRTDAAYALDEAVRQLRVKVGETNFARWVPYVHFGV